jgi:ribosome-binding factor A
MSTFRIIRVNERLKRVISEYLHTRFARESVAITVVRVDASPDWRTADVYYSVFSESEKEAAARLFRRLSGRLHTVIADEVRLKYSPRLRFLPDDTYAKAHAVVAHTLRLEA